MINRLYLVIVFLLILLSCSPRPDIPDETLQYIWSGAVTDSSAVVSFKTNGASSGKLVIIESGGGDTVFISSKIETTAENYFVDKVPVYGLKADTHYNYILQLEQSEDLQGSFSTFPSGPASFNFAFASCARTGSDNRVFRVINEQEPLFYMNVGDFHYGNIDEDCAYNFAEAYFDNLSSNNQSSLYRDHPFVYVWDDHDFGPNNSSGQAPCKEQALAAFRHFIPHYDLPFEKDGPVSQSFIVGRVKFILTDLRSFKVKPKYKGCRLVENGTNFGFSDHIDWFFGELLEAKAKNQIVAWVNPIPWISTPQSPKYECDEKDDWGGYKEERELIATFIQDNEIPLFILSGDAHMLAIDDGSNTRFAKSNKIPVPVFHAAPLDNVGIIKGGPYSHGYSIKRGQFGLVKVSDSGKEICITFLGMSNSGRPARNVEGHILEYTFCRNL